MPRYQRKGKKYTKITYEERMQLLDLILNQGQKITETAKKLHLKLPTVKAILSNYRKKNHVFQRKNETLPLKELVSTNQNHAIQDLSQDFERISPAEQQKCQYIKNGAQLNENELSQNDVSYPYSLWYGNINLWGYFYSPFNFYQF